MDDLQDVYRRRCVVLDTETTGLSPAEGHRIVEIGLVEMRNSLPTGRSERFFLNPERSVPQEAQAVHGLTDEFLADKPFFSEIREDLLAFLSGDPLIAHNAAFDMGFLNYELSLMGADPLENKVIDTLALARERFPGRAVSLGHLCHMFGVDTTKREKHGALLDASLLAEVFIFLVGGPQQSLDFKTPPSLLERPSAPADPYKGRHKDPVALTEAEEQKHKAFLAVLKKPLWLAALAGLAVVSFFAPPARASERLYRFADLAKEQRDVVLMIKRWIEGQQALRAHFVQYDENGARTEGQFAMIRPYHLMFDYKDPPIKVYSVRGWIVMVDKKTKQQNLYPMGDTPFQFFLKSEVDMEAARFGYWGIAQRNSRLFLSMTDIDKRATGSVSFEFLTFPMRLVALKTQDAQGNVVEVHFSDIDTHATVPYSLFPQPKELVPSLRVPPPPRAASKPASP